jgi:hypothetical protein
VPPVNTEKYYIAYIPVQFICVHVCLCKTYNGGSHVASSCRCSEYVAINKLFEYLFARMLASHRGGLASIPGQDMSVSDALVKYGDDIGQVSP